MTPLAPIVMFGWIPLVIFLFAKLKPSHHAVVAGFILAWCFLPQAEFKLPGIPVYDKTSAAGYGILLGAFIFDRRIFSQFKPHFLDLPVALWCFSSFISSITNGLGAYDGVSATQGKIAEWFIPYFIGRLYFNRPEALRDLAIGILIGALIYIPLCWIELVISPRLHKIIYGFSVGNFAQTKRSGGWRPMVFMKHGLMCAMWLASGALAGLRLFFSKNIGKKIPLLGVSSLIALAILVVTLVLCKSFGALVLMIVGAIIIPVAARLRTFIPIIAIIIVPVLYEVTRGTGLWDAQNLIDTSLAISNADRADSLAFRIKNENVLIAKALDQKWFGWAGWKRSFIFNDAGVAVSVPDGLWIIALGQNGLVGLTALTLTLLVPQLLFLRMFPIKRWPEKGIAAIAPLSLLLGLFMIDNLFNDMFNPAMLLSAGGITGLYIRHARRENLFPDETGAPATAPPPQPGPRLL